jgi:cell division protein FtsB
MLHKAPPPGGAFSFCAYGRVRPAFFIPTNPSGTQAFFCLACEYGKLGRLKETQCMRLLTLILLLLLGGLQYDLWLGKNGLSDYRELSTAIERQQQDNLVLKDRNSLIYREIDDLTSGLEAIEELSRNDLGYIKQGETFYRIIPKEKDQVTEPDGAPYDD